MSLLIWIAVSVLIAIIVGWRYLLPGLALYALCYALMISVARWLRPGSTHRTPPPGRDADSHRSESP